METGRGWYFGKMAVVQGGGRISAEARVEAGGLVPAAARPGGMVLRMGSWRQCTEWRQILEVRALGLGDSPAKENGGGAEWGRVCWEDRENSI